MTSSQAVVAERPGQAPAKALADDQLPPAADDSAAEAVLAEELLVEEVSIDGMCGVY